jgi:hypothetical protein
MSAADSRAATLRVILSRRHALTRHHAIAHDADAAHEMLPAL